MSDINHPIAEGIPNRTLVINDNLPVLAAMPDACVDLIYLDPPFNSKRAYYNPISIPPEYAEGLYRDYTSMGATIIQAGFDDNWTMDLMVRDTEGNLTPNPNWKPLWMGAIAEFYPALHAVLRSAGLAQDSQLQGYLTFMAVRLLEMRRVLKLTGSIYLHCDPTAGHYLKAVMDCIFGRDNFLNDLTWKRHSSHNDVSRRFGKVHDTILFYSKSQKYTWTGEAREPYDEEYLAKSYKNSDSNGRYTTAPLSGRGVAGALYEYEWRGIKRDTWRFPKERLDELDANGLLHWPPRGRIPRRKVYLDKDRGIAARDVILDIKPIATGPEKKSDYPTQKPLALLDRIIRASSNPGDVVLDPFCGCATACVAAERLGRRWMGIDRGEEAYNQVVQRLASTVQIGSKEIPLLLEPEDHVTRLTELPGQTYDVRVAAPITEPRQRRQPVGRVRVEDNIKRLLYGLQEGDCIGCADSISYHNAHVDHVVPDSKGGPTEQWNLQLLCGYCNSRKGDRWTTQILWDNNEIEGILRDRVRVERLWRMREPERVNRVMGF